MKTTQHTPALEAAKAINARFEETHGVQLSRYEIASLIVQYYGNAHYELLEALRECITDPGAAAFMQEGEHPYRRLRAINEIARAAIAKAEGKE